MDCEYLEPLDLTKIVIIGCLVISSVLMIPSIIHMIVRKKILVSCQPNIVNSLNDRADLDLVLSHVPLPLLPQDYLPESQPPVSDVEPATCLFNLQSPSPEHLSIQEFHSSGSSQHHDRKFNTLQSQL